MIRMWEINITRTSREKLPDLIGVLSNLVELRFEVALNFSKIYPEKLVTLKLPCRKMIRMWEINMVGILSMYLAYMTVCTKVCV